MPRSESDSAALRRYDASVRVGGELRVHSFTEWGVHDVLAKIGKLVTTEPGSPPSGYPLVIEIRRLG